MITNPYERIIRLRKAIEEALKHLTQEDHAEQILENALDKDDSSREEQ